MLSDHSEGDGKATLAFSTTRSQQAQQSKVVEVERLCVARRMRQRDYCE